LICGYDGVKVFSTTHNRERETLGERVTEWTSWQREVEVIAMTSLQSSGASYHCFSIVVFFKGRPR
jgi:hypothetical protein